MNQTELLFCLTLTKDISEVIFSSLLSATAPTRASSLAARSKPGALRALSWTFRNCLGFFGIEVVFLDLSWIFWNWVVKLESTTARRHPVDLSLGL